MSREFKRQDHFRYKKLGIKWRRPKGRQSKLRKGKAGNPGIPSIGRGRKASLRHIVGDKKLALIRNKADLEKIGDNVTAVISSHVGLKKAAEIAKKADEMNIVIANRKRLKRLEKLVKKKAKQADEKKDKKKTEQKDERSLLAKEVKKEKTKRVDEKKIEEAKKE